MAGTPDNSTDGTRRSFVKAVGVGGATVALAGCVGFGGDEGDGGDGGDGSDGGDDTTTTSDGDETDDTTTESGPDSITVGQPGSITGKWDNLQPAVSQATDLALEQINGAGGPLGAELVLERRDTAVDPQQARQVLRQHVDNDDARAILGLFSSEISPMWDFVQEQEVPIVTPWPGSTFLDSRGGDKGTPEDLSDDEWVWRTVIGDTVHTLGAAQHMIDEGFDRMGVINGASEGERSWADSFIDAYENNGGTVANRVEVSEGKSSYQSELDRLFSEEFDAWAMAVALEDATTIIRNWSDGGYGGQLLMEDGLRDENLIEAVGDQADGAWIAAGTGEGPNYDSFIESYESAGDAAIHPWGVAAYDATNVVALAIHRAGSADPADVERNLGRVTRAGDDRVEVSTFAEGKEALDGGDEINYQGAGNTTDFTDHGNVLGSVGVSRVTPDGFEQHAVVPADDLKGLIDTY